MREYPSPLVTFALPHGREEIAQRFRTTCVGHTFIEGHALDEHCTAYVFAPFDVIYRELVRWKNHDLIPALFKAPGVTWEPAPYGGYTRNTGVKCRYCEQELWETYEEDDGFVLDAKVECGGEGNGTCDRSAVVRDLGGVWMPWDHGALFHVRSCDGAVRLSGGYAAVFRHGGRMANGHVEVCAMHDGCTESIGIVDLETEPRESVAFEVFRLIHQHQQKKGDASCP